MGRISTFVSRDLQLDLDRFETHREILDGFEAGEYDTAVLNCGRQGGKSTLACELALYDAVGRDHLRSKLRPGVRRGAAIIAPTQEQANDRIRDCLVLIRNGNQHLQGLLVSESPDELAFSNGAVIKAFPCSARHLRGGSWSTVIFDELGHYLTTTAGNAAGDEIYEAARPTQSIFGFDAWTIAISTPRWRQGKFWTLCEQAQSGKFPRMMYRHYTTQEMNPDINPAWLEARRLENPDSFRREYLAEWTSGEGSYIDQDAVLACIRKDIGTLEPVEGVRYVSFLDPAYRLDSFVQAVAHKNAAGRVIIDGVFSWTKKGHGRTLDAVAAVCRRYGIATLGSDQHGFDAIEDSLKKRGIVAVLKPWSNSSKEVALPALKVAFETGAIQIPDDDATFQELAIFEASPTAGGLTRYAAAGSGHDDRVMAIAGALMALKGKREHADVAAALGAINAGLARTGPRPEPFGFGSTGRSPMGWSGGPDAGSGA